MNWKKAGAAAMAGLSFLYLLNPTMGIFELLPDNIPGIGNLDEGTAGVLLLWGIQTLIQKKGGHKDEKSENP